MTVRPSIVLVLVVLATLGVGPAGAEQQAPEEDERNPPCEPVSVGFVVDWSTSPPIVYPNVWIRPECI